MNPTRRTFLQSLAALFAWPWAPWHKPLVFTDGFARFHFDGFPGKWIIEAYWTVNSKPWRGHAPGTVQLVGCDWDREEGADFEFRQHGESLPLLDIDGKPVEWMSFADIGLSAGAIYGESDFNAFDFGRQVG